MSTSPSWFDQEKFSRLVKKVGPKTPPAVEPSSTHQPAASPIANAPAASAPPARPATQPLPVEPPPQAPEPQTSESDAVPPGLASTARISLVSRPPSLMAEQRALPALPRRTAPLPGLKSLFEGKHESGPIPRTEEPIRAPAIPESSSEESMRATGPLPMPADKTEDIRSEAPPVADAPTPAPVPENEIADSDVESIWHKMALLNEELAHAVHERDQAVADANVLRDQLRSSEDDLKGDQNAEATKEEFSRLIRERDDAVAQAQQLRTQLEFATSAVAAMKPAAPPVFGKPPADITKTKELVMLTSERDQARKEYAELRKEYEVLKQGTATGALPSPAASDSAKVRKELEQQLEGFRVKLEEKNREITLLKAGGGAGGNNPLLEEINTLREQLTKSKDEASIAQRGLALSQKALHETRETLREATEGTSLSRHNFDNLKSEVSALTQQNTTLQSQNEQLTRELAAAKSKLTSRV